MRPITVQVGPLVAASTTNIKTTAAIAGAGAVTLNGTLVSGGVATLDTARRVIFTSAGNDTGITFTISGTNWSGLVISETVTGASGGAASTVLDYKTVTGVTSSGASAGNVSIGTNGVAGSPWVRFDDWAQSQVMLQTKVSGTVNYSIQTTMDDPNSPTNPVAPSAVTWFDVGDTNVVGATASAQSSFATLPLFARVLLNSQTNPGYVTATFSQTGSS